MKLTPLTENFKQFLKKENEVTNQVGRLPDLSAIKKSVSIKDLMKWLSRFSEDTEVYFSPHAGPIGDTETADEDDHLGAFGYSQGLSNSRVSSLVIYPHSDYSKDPDFERS